jgi:hypothetical protein
VAAGAGRATIGTGSCSPTNVPIIWSCALASYGGGDGCDCGCGAVDPDCASASSAACTGGCKTAGSCASSCSQVAPNNNATCANVPAGWTCSPFYYGSGSGCDCGCGALDPDCMGNASALNCDYCNDPGACSQTCDSIDANNNAVCDIPGWTCDPRAYRDGTTCDCGCGIVDPDCPNNTSTGCTNCVQAGSCATTSCAEIDPVLNAVCN